jgi:hypothetical protein
MHGHGAGLWCHSVGLSLGRPPLMWPWAIHAAMFSSCFLSFWRACNIHIHIYTYIRILGILRLYSPVFPCPQPHQVGVAELRLDMRRLLGGGIHRRLSWPRALQGRAPCCFRLGLHWVPCPGWETPRSWNSSSCRRPWAWTLWGTLVVWAHVDISYAAPQAHRIVNVALHVEYSRSIIFIFSQGRKDLYHV